MATETLIGNGIRQNFAGLGDRNFEDSGTVQYASNQNGLNVNGTVYNLGQTIAFDVGGVSYSVPVIEALRFFWNQGAILALT